MNSPCTAMLRVLRRSLVAARYRSELPYEFNDGGADRDENNRRQNKNHQWGNHLNRGFCSLLFGALPALRAEGIGMHAEGLSNACAETVGLDQCTHKRTNVVNSGTLDEIAQGFGARLAGAHFEIHEMEFIAEIGMRVMKILAHAHQGLIESESSFHADNGQIEGVGESEANAVLTVFDHALEDEARQDEPKRSDADDKWKIVEA